LMTSPGGELDPLIVEGINIVNLLDLEARV
jgi:hypothetical protein